MANSAAIIAALADAGIEAAAFEVKPGHVEIRIPGYTSADIDAVEKVLPTIEACGFAVIGYGSGIRSNKDGAVGASIFLMAKAQAA